MVDHDLCTEDLPVLGKHCEQLFICELISNVLDIHIGEPLVLTKVSKTMLAADELANLPGKREGEYVMNMCLL